MGCSEAEQILPLLFNRAPSPVRALHLRVHLDKCSACRELLANMLLARAMGLVLRQNWGERLRPLDQ